MPRAQIKDEKMYTELRGEGASKEKAARIANQAAATSRSRVDRKGGKKRLARSSPWSASDHLADCAVTW